MRAAVFLAMEDQDRLENKTPLINENLKKCLNTKDGHLVASLIMDFLQVFNLDFSLAVFQPEINSVSPQLRLRASPLWSVVVNAGSHRELSSSEPASRRTKQISHARKTFDSHDKDQSGSVRKEDLKLVFTDLLPGLNKSMLERFVDEELRAADSSESLFSKVDFQSFLSTYKRLFDQCRSVVRGSFTRDLLLSCVETLFVGQDLEQVLSLPKRYQQEQPTAGSAAHLDLELDGDVDHDEGDSFFDDPLPKPLKTYGW
uniref:Centrosomal protein 43 n=1 Tax=Poecilia latipinna TaxID=48699 RepID=A0A3B3UC77_9TELE